MTLAPDWSAFDWLIAPLDRAMFLEEVWERRPQAIHRADPGYFCSLVGRADVDTIARTIRVRPVEADQQLQELRVVRFIDGAPQSEPVVADADGSPNLYQLYRSYAAGWSVILASLSERWPPITSLCARLETALHHPMTACLYLTPPEAQGFPAHHDTVDVFIVQVEGTKAWRVYPPTRELPPVDAPLHYLTLSADSAQDVRLDAGDVLYVPRGWIHEARTSAAPSLHVTLGVQVTRWSDLLIDVVTAVAEGDVRLREAAPPGYLHADRGLGDRLRGLLAELAEVDEGTLDRAIDRAAQRFLGAAHSTVGGHFVSLDELPALTLDSQVQIVSALCRVAGDGDGVSLQLPGRRVRYPRSVEPALRHLASGQPSAVDALAGGLSDDAKLVLVRRLVRDGVVRVVPG